MTTVNQNTSTSTVESGDDDTTVTTTTATTQVDGDAGDVAPGTLLASLASVDGAGSGLDADKLDGQDGAYYATAAADAAKLPLAGGTMTGAIQTAVWSGTSWHNGSTVQSFTADPVLLFTGSDNGAYRLGLFVDANHLVVAESSDSGANWTAIHFIDHASGTGGNGLIRFLNDTGFNTGLVNIDNSGFAGTWGDRIGVGLGTDFTSVATYDNASSSEIRWWFGTAGDYDFVPGKHNSYDIGEAVRAVRTVHAMTGTFQTDVTVGGASVATQTYAAALVDDLSGVSNASTARTNLGLGSLATLSTVTTSEITDGTIASGDLADNAAFANTQTLNNQTDSYTLVLGDKGKLVTLNKASAVTLTVPANASVAFPIGTHVDLMQLGAGQVTVSITSDTLRSTPGSKLRAQYSGATLVKIDTTTWALFGDLSA